VALHRDPDATLRDVAKLVGITERAVLQIVADLEEEGIVRRVRNGRRNHYEFSLDIPLRHPMEAAHSVDELVRVLAK
jgi:predicted ArsR family transcriptional regulator